MADTPTPPSQHAPTPAQRQSSPVVPVIPYHIPPPPPPRTPAPALPPPTLAQYYQHLFYTDKGEDPLPRGAWDRSDRTDDFLPSASDAALFPHDARIPFDHTLTAMETHGYHLPSIYVGKPISNKLHNWASNPALRPRLLMATRHLYDQGVTSDLACHHMMTRQLSCIRRKIALETRKMNSIQVLLEDVDYRLLAADAEAQLLPWMDPQPAQSPPPSDRRNPRRRNATPTGEFTRVIEGGWSANPF